MRLLKFDEKMDDRKLRKLQKLHKEFIFGVRNS